MEPSAETAPPLGVSMVVLQLGQAFSGHLHQPLPLWFWALINRISFLMRNTDEI